MFVPLPGNSLLNVAHISLVSGVQKGPNGGDEHVLRILIMGQHKHIASGSLDEMKQLHARIRGALDQLGATLPSE